MAIKSICPKCGKMGTQAITYHPNKINSKFNYLEIIHSKKKRCYIGRIRSTEEAMGELNKPETVEEYKEALDNIAKELRTLINRYSSMNQGSVQSISRRLRAILDRYGY